MKSKLFTCFVALLASLAAMGQTRSVSGTVVDNLGPVTGASVIEKGTRNGTITDLDGNFTIKVREGSVLEISSIGYKTVEVKVDEQGAHRDTRVIYQYIDTSKTFDGLLDKVATIVLDSDIRLDTQHFRRLRHLRLYLKELVIGAGCEYKFRAF